MKQAISNICIYSQVILLQITQIESYLIDLSIILLSMFKIAGIDLKHKKNNLKIIKIQHILNRALGEIKHPQNPTCNPQSPCKRKSQQSQTEATCQLLDKFKRGYLLAKHSPNTSIPHMKFVYISSDCKFLCWKSLDRDDEKQFPLLSIKQVLKEGCQHYIMGERMIRDKRCCIVVVSTIRTLQLQAGSQFQAECFKYELERVVKFSKGMSQNYPYLN